MKAAVLLIVSATLALPQEEGDARARVRGVRELSRGGEDAIAKITPYLRDVEISVRIEAVKGLVEIGGPKTLDGLLQAARDNDAEMQMRATDGLVNIYLPGYIKTGISGSIQRAGTAIRARFTDTNDQVIDPYVQVRADVIEGLGRIAGGGSSFDSRANAARAVGILRGRAAIPDLIDALRSKDSRLMYESLIALEKIGDPEAAPRMAFLLRDLDEKVQMAALETTGVLRNKEAAPTVRDVLDRARSDKIRRSAAATLAMIGDLADHPRFIGLLADRDDAVRAAAAEGLGRMKNQVDRPVLERTFAAERNTNARLSEAFALASLGSLDTGELMPFRYLINTLNLKSYKGVALAFLIELARDPRVRQVMYPMLARATKDERIGISNVLGRSGDKDSVTYLEALSMDGDAEVAQQGIRDLRALRARL